MALNASSLKVAFAWSYESGYSHVSAPPAVESVGASLPAGPSLLAGEESVVTSSPPPDDTTTATTMTMMAIRAPMGPHFFNDLDPPDPFSDELLAGCMIIPLALNGRSRHLMCLNMTQ